VVAIGRCFPRRTNIPRWSTGILSDPVDAVFKALGIDHEEGGDVDSPQALAQAP
jgi:hypothetical protein